MAVQNTSPQIPVIHYNKKIHALLFILICVLIASFAVICLLNKSFRSAPDPDPNAAQLEMQKQQAFRDIKAQISTAPPISKQQKDKAFEEITRIMAQQKK